jgi:hypothetical protein
MWDEKRKEKLVQVLPKKQTLNSLNSRHKVMKVLFK